MAALGSNARQGQSGSPVCTPCYSWDLRCYTPLLGRDLLCGVQGGDTLLSCKHCQRFLQDKALVSLSDAAGGPPAAALCVSFELRPGSRPGPAKLFEATADTWQESGAAVQIRGPGTPAALINLSSVRRRRCAYPVWRRRLPCWPGCSDVVHLISLRLRDARTPRHASPRPKVCACEKYWLVATCLATGLHSVPQCYDSALPSFLHKKRRS